MKRLAAVLILSLPMIDARAQGAQIPPPPAVPEQLRSAVSNLGADLLVSLMQVGLPSSGQRSWCVGTANTVLVNVENRGGNIFPKPVDVVLTGYSRSVKVPPVTYRYTIDGNTRYVSPPGHKIYVVTFRNVRVNQSWMGNNWWYKVELKPQNSGGATIGNRIDLPVGSGLQACA